MESEADRRAGIVALGGKCYSTAVGPLLAIFDNEFLEAGDTEARRPMLTCTSEDAARVLADRKGTTIDIDGTVYRIRRHEPDGTGMSTIPLER
jgi:hypothetical protein